MYILALNSEPSHLSKFMQIKDLDSDFRDLVFYEVWDIWITKY